MVKSCKIVNKNYWVTRRSKLTYFIHIYNFNLLAVFNFNVNMNAQAVSVNLHPILCDQKVCCKRKKYLLEIPHVTTFSFLIRISKY